MSPNESQRKTLAVAALAEMFNRQLTQAGLLMYLRGLQGLDAEAVEHAATEAAMTCKFMPLPVEFRELAGEARPEDRALLAWQAFAAAVESVGSYRSPNFDDGLINATVRALGGWMYCCEQPTTEFEKWLQPRFVKTYTAFTRTGVSDEAAAPLVGYFEQQNGILGYHRPQDRVEIRTGLPWAGEPVKRLGSDRPHADQAVPRIELQKP